MNRAARVRAIALAIAITFVGATLALAFPRNGAGTVTVTAYFTKAIGLFKDSHVRVLGVDIGRVTSVKPQGRQVQVVMKIDAERKVPADAHAVIVPISLIADRYVQLTPVYSSGPVMRNGSVIDLDRTAIPAELDELLAQLKKLLDAVKTGTDANPQSIGAAITNLAAALAGEGGDLSATLSGAGALSGAVTQNAAALDQTVVSLSRLLAALQQRRDDIAQLNTRLADALGAVADEHATLDSALSNIALLTEQLGSLVKDHRANLESDLSVLARTTAVLTRHQDSLIRSLRWLHVLTDGVEMSHNGGAIHREGTGPYHIDVRDAHLFACPPGVESTICLLIGLTDGSLPVGLAIPGAPAAVGTPAAPRASVTGLAPAAPAPPDPTNLLHLLPRLPAGGANASPAPTIAPTPLLRQLFNGLGGLLDHTLGWLW